MRIGVFDSGIGGKAIEMSLRKEFITAEIIRVSDRAHVPYGNRSPAEILRLTTRAIQPLLESECEVIIIACNTATAVAAPQLRLDVPLQLFIGIEPMIKPARKLSNTKTVAVFATPATLNSKAYKRLKLLHGAGIEFVEPDCSTWATMLETDSLSRNAIESVTQQCLERNADVIVLGCTHYIWIKHEIQQIAAGRAVVIEPSAAIGARVRQLLENS